MRRNLILRKLIIAGADSPETAVTLAEAGVINPDAFTRLNDWLVRKGWIRRTADGRYYLPQ